VTIARLRAAFAVLLLLALAGCSFRGSVTAAGTSAASSSGHRGGAPSSSVTGGTTAGGTPTPSASGAAASTSPGGGAGGTVSRCHTGELTGSLVPGSPGAGQRYATLVLENTGGRTCTLHGYGGIGLVDSAGSPLPTHQVRIASPAPATVTLAPHGTARSQLHWSAVAGTGDSTSGPCQPAPAALQVIPPDETDHLSVAWGQGPVCEGGTISQQAYTG
jgi:Protein of unknown function (DUF4232)